MLALINLIIHESGSKDRSALTIYSSLLENNNEEVRGTSKLSNKTKKNSERDKNLVEKIKAKKLSKETPTGPEDESDAVEEA